MAIDMRLHSRKKAQEVKRIAHRESTNFLMCSVLRPEVD